MLGLLGALIFGGIVTGAWISADQSEKRQRSNAKKYLNDIYVDKWGKRRHATTGKRYTKEESLQDIRTERQQGIRNQYDIYVKFKENTNRVSLNKVEIMSFEEWYEKKYGKKPENDRFWNM